jgi:hypothetical protein
VNGLANLPQVVLGPLVVSYVMVLRVGWVPGRWRAPELSRPAARPARAEGRGADLFVKHPVLGDLTLPEWLRFHAWHCAHHARQIRTRLGR